MQNITDFNIYSEDSFNSSSLNEPKSDPCAFITLGIMGIWVAATSAYTIHSLFNLGRKTLNAKSSESMSKQDKIIDLIFKQCQGTYSQENIERCVRDLEITAFIEKRGLISGLFCNDSIFLTVKNRMNSKEESRLHSMDEFISLYIKELTADEITKQDDRERLKEEAIERLAEETFDHLQKAPRDMPAYTKEDLTELIKEINPQARLHSTRSFWRLYQKTSEIKYSVTYKEDFSPKKFAAQLMYQAGVIAQPS